MKIAYFLLAICAIILFGCTSQQSVTEDLILEPSTILVVSGSGSMTAILEAIKEDFAADTPGYRLKVLAGTGTDGGIEGTVNGILDLAAMAREPKEGESIDFTFVGYGAQAIYSHSEVGVANLSSEQIVDIFSGEITNWSEVGGADKPIVVFVRDEGDSSTKSLRQFLIGDISFAQTAQVLTSQRDMQLAVENTPNAIGIGTWPTAIAKAVNIQPINIDGISPIDSGYKMTTILGVGYLPERKSDVQPFLDWLLSDTGQNRLQEIAVITSE